MTFFVIRAFILGTAKGIKPDRDLQSPFCIYPKVKHPSDQPHLSVYCTDARTDSVSECSDSITLKTPKEYQAARKIAKTGKLERRCPGKAINKILA
jgi:hypothetical protein